MHFTTNSAQRHPITPNTPMAQSAAGVAAEQRLARSAEQVCSFLTDVVGMSRAEAASMTGAARARPSVPGRAAALWAMGVLGVIGCR